MDKSIFKSICDEYKRNYVEIFKHIYPSKNSTGFTERNLSVNFSKAYEKIITKENQDCISWFEFQFDETNNKHYDAIIINSTVKEILVIEAKRYNNLSRKINSVINDIARINKFLTEILRKDDRRIPSIESYKIYGVILADIWIGNTSSVKQKNIVKKQYIDNSFIKDNKYINNDSKRSLSGLKFIYNVEDFTDCIESIKSESICNDYSLLSILWELPIRPNNKS